MTECKTEYITKEQALEAIEGKMWPGELEAAIKAIPPIDVVKVMRCEDCRYYNAYVGYPMGDCMYWIMEEDLPIKLPVYGNDFCSRGKSI